MNRALALPLVLACTLAAALGCSAPPSGGMRPSSTDGGDGGSKNAGGAGSTAESTSQGGQPEGAVTLSREQQQLGGIRVAEVAPRTVPRTLSVPSQIVMDEQRTAHISPYFDGSVVAVHRYAGDSVHRGEALAEVHSHSVHETVGALAQNYSNLARAQSAVAFAQGKRDRYQHLYGIQAASLEQQQGSQQELVQAETDRANAQAAVTMEREHLADLLQIEPEAISPATLYTYENLPIKTPLSGTVITRSVTPGSVVEPGTEAYTVSDLGEVWDVAAVNEAELPYLRVGQHVTIRSDAWPGETFAGRITLIGSTLDPATRTIQVRASVPNPKNKLKPLMFTTATIDEVQAGTRQAIFIPEAVVQEVNGVQVAFLTSDGTHFTPRALKLAPPVGGEVEVTEGLRPGDHIAVSGAFMLKSDLLKSTMDSE